MGQIQVRNVTKTWGDFNALKKIDLEVHKGEFLSILGPSGCGKSTLLRIIAGLEEPSGGDIVIAGANVTKDPVWKRKIGFVFQNFALWPHLSAYRNVSMGLELRKTPKDELHKRVTQALQLVQLENFAERLPSQLSGGQQQRVALARAIVLQPEVLLLDEPLSALDKNLRENMQVELKTLQQTLGLTTIFVTHDQEEALSLSDRVVVMNRGSIEQIDQPVHLYNQPVSEYVADFVGEATFFTGTIDDSRNHAMLRLENGQLIPLEGDDLLAGKTARAFVRPEWIELGDNGKDKGTDLTCVIDRVMFFGQSSDYLVRFGEHHMRVKKRHDAPEFMPGQTVAIHVGARALPETGNSQ